MEYSFTGLHKETDAGEFIRHHSAVRQWHEPYMEKAEQCTNFARGIHHTPEDLASYKRKRKDPVTFRGELAPMRTIIGQFIQSKYDIKPAPVEPNDQATADPLVHMYHWTADGANVKLKDIDIFKQTYVTGSAFQESYVEITDGKRPNICVTNQNRFAIYWDPNSRDLINRDDAEFWDRETFLSYQEMLDRFPEKADLISTSLANRDQAEKGGYENVTLHADRSHENSTAKNGQYKVIERFYRVRKRNQFGIPKPGEQGQRINIGEDVEAKTLSGFQKDYPHYQIRSTPMEYTYYAVACEAVSMTDFLTNGPYHWQPRDPKSGKVLWTLIESVAESLGGEATGFIEAEISPLKIIDAMMANILHAARHSVNNAMFVDRSKFNSDDDYNDFIKNASDSDRRFPVKPGALDGGTPASSVPQSVTTQDNKDALTMASQTLEEVSSAPKPLRGAVEQSGTPAAQTEMRIQQSLTQLLGLITNWKHFLTKRAKLWQAMWREFFPYEMQIRVLEKKNPDDPDFITINEPVGIDEQGNVVRANSIDAAIFDITFEDSMQSPTAKDAVRQGLVQILNMAQSIDPVMSSWLIVKFLELADLPADDKRFLQKHMQVIQQAEQQKAAAEQQGKQLENVGAMQNLAQAEAQQTALPPASSAAQPPGPPPSRDQALQPA